MKTVAVALAMAALFGCAPKNENPPTGRKTPQLPIRVEITKDRDLYRVGDTIELQISILNLLEVPITLRIDGTEIASRKNWWNRNWKMNADATPMQYPDGSEEWPVSIGLPYFDVSAEFVTIAPDEPFSISHSMPAKVTGEWDYVVIVDSRSQRIFRDPGSDWYPGGAKQAKERLEWEERWRRYKEEGWERSDDTTYVRMKVDRGVIIGTSKAASVAVVVR
jgi:hypothetical protein